MTHLSRVSGIIVAVATLVPAGSAVAASDASCASGKLCKLGAKQPAAFKRGKVNGAAVFEEPRGKARISITSKTLKTTVYTVAICGAKRVETLHFEEGGKHADVKVASPKGKLKNCDSYEIKTATLTDELRVTPKGKTFKFYFRKDGKATGYEVYLTDTTLPGREGAYHFKVK